MPRAGPAVAVLAPPVQVATPHDGMRVVAAYALPSRVVPTYPLLRLPALGTAFSSTGTLA